MIQSETINRVHIALPVDDLEASRLFYTNLFASEPVKIKLNYIKFAPNDIPINLSLNLRDTAPTVTVGAAHFGVEVADHMHIEKLRSRSEASKVSYDAKNEVNCCYSQQSKLWLSDPNGNSWEFYVIENNDIDNYNCDCGTSAETMRSCLC